MALATVESRSGPSDGRRYTQCTGLPATTFGTRSPVAGEPHHDAEASFGAVAVVA